MENKENKENKEKKSRAKWVIAYEKENYHRLNVRLSKKYDQDIIEYLNQFKNKASYIKSVLRELAHEHIILNIIE